MSNYIFVEEQSSAVFIKALVASLPFNSPPVIFEHQGAGDLENSIRIKIPALFNNESRFLILRDQDLNDCIRIKERIFNSLPERVRPKCIVRIACRELESWYIAQPSALQRSGVLKSALPNSILSKNPDSIIDPKRELHRRSHKSGQIWLAQKISNHIDLHNFRSLSFRFFVQSLTGMAT
jgi:hypothetical protein